LPSFASVCFTCTRGIFRLRWGIIRFGALDTTAFCSNQRSAVAGWTFGGHSGGRGGGLKVSGHADIGLADIGLAAIGLADIGLGDIDVPGTVASMHHGRRRRRRRRRTVPPRNEDWSCWVTVTEYVQQPLRRSLQTKGVNKVQVAHRE
jgi:hypothetical protein